MDVRENQVSESVADTLSLGQIDSKVSHVILDIKRSGERQFVLRATSKELIEYMNKTKWLRLSYKNYKLKNAKFWVDYYPFSRCTVS